MAAPTSRAIVRLSSAGSTAITCAGDRARRICTAVLPSPPTPMTTAVAPGSSKWSERLTAW